MGRFHNRWSLPSSFQQLMVMLLLIISIGGIIVQSSRPYDETLMLDLYAPQPEWQYPFEGWSYYIRATNLLREQARAELGWGQWSSPSAPEGFNEVCSLDPLLFTCDGGVTTRNLRNCGGDYETREACTYWECGFDDKGGVQGTIEGGMGYWPGYTIEKSQVTWQVPGSTSVNYELIGGTMLGARPVPCMNLGGAVRVSNRLLVPNDFISFEGGPKADGFLGYMMQRTPIGKRSETDTANYWTIIADTANFKGPVLYMSAYFWDSHLNWHPKSKNWAHPDVSLGYVAHGVEGRIAAMISDEQDSNGNRYAHTQQWGMPLDKNSNVHSTLFTGHAQYGDGWLDSLLNDVMDGVSSSTPDIVGVSTAARTITPCFPPEERHNYEPRAILEYENEDDEFDYDDFTITDFGVTSVDASNADNNNLGCPTKFLLDRSKLDCETEQDFCLVSKYFTFGFEGESKMPSEVPDDVKRTLDTEHKFPTHRIDNRRANGPPAGPERECYEDPGPASPMYCVRTATESWIGFKWYRFVDQPELTNVFKSLPVSERAAAKNYMQARIENFHRQVGKDIPWFEPPGGNDALPKEKISIDEALILTPPAGMEVGYVPVPLYQRKKVRPVDCEVVVGAYENEPEPLPTDYYDEFDEQYYERDNMQCAGPEVDGLTYPGLIFPTPPDPSADRMQYAYNVPLPDYNFPDAVTVPIENPRIELDDRIPTHGGDTGGDPVGYSPSIDSVDNGGDPDPSLTLGVEQGFCFSSHNTVHVLNKGITTMDKIKVGDKVLTGNGNYETIYTIDHRHPTKETIFVQIHYNNQETHHKQEEESSSKINYQPLELTERHMVFLHNKSIPIAASLVHVGDQLRTSLNNDEISSSTAAAVLVVTKIDYVKRRGVYNPITMDGTIVVNNGGIVTSTYSTLFKSGEYLEIFGYDKVMSYQTFFNKILKPYKFICTGISLELCKTSNERIGISYFATNVFYHYLIRQNQKKNHQTIALGIILILAHVVDFFFSYYGILFMLLLTTAVTVACVKMKTTARITISTSRWSIIKKQKIA